MSSRLICSAPDCTQRCFATAEFCLGHHGDPEAVASQYRELINREPVLRDLVVPLLNLDGIDFSHKTLIDCDFHGASFGNCQFNETNMTFCLFDHAQFARCKFHESKILESVFAGGLLRECEFSVCDAIQCNFNGCQTSNSRFMACDLMYSRFLSIQGEAMVFEDCNLKGVYFNAPCPDWISFSYSNKEDAFFI